MVSNGRNILYKHIQSNCTGITATETYTVVVTDGNLCSASDAVLVTVTNSPPLASISASGNTSWCANSGSSVNLTANISGGSTASGYSWSGSNITATNTQVVTVNPNTAGSYIYTVTVTDASGCIASASATITVHANPQASAGVDTAICAGQNVNIGGSPSASGGTGPYTYSWSVGGTLPVANPLVSPAGTATYILLGTDLNGCTSNSNVTVIVRPNPVVMQEQMHRSTHVAQAV
ncbi:MAG: PKD domain-containing protein [Bacteroidetes bacterium]|nr:PKD domain-containing protein [Bacteroidota bacterium]